uniref:Secreted protein n=1 Tax=Solanum tuberosum TaxID=4113 RepID=M1DN71_SOLTU
MHEWLLVLSLYFRKVSKASFEDKCSQGGDNVTLRKMWSSPRLMKAARGLALAMKMWPPFSLATASTSMAITTTMGGAHGVALVNEQRAPSGEAIASRTMRGTTTRGFHHDS